jgi:hypothetical protein
LAFISEFNVQMLYLPGLNCWWRFFVSPLPSAPGSAETVAASAVANPVDSEAMAAEQNAALAQRCIPPMAFRPAGAQRLAGNVSTGVFCPIVPQKFRKDIFAHFHNISHPRRLASQRMVSSRFVWRGHASDVTAWPWSRACLHCQQAKIHRQMRLQSQPVPIPQRRFSHLHINLVGPLQYSGGFNFIFNIIDCTSKWMEAVPLSDLSAAVCAKALLFS